MTKEQKTLREITAFLNQHADGYVLICFHPENQEPMVAVAAVDGKTETALNALLGGILNQGGVGPVQEQIRAKLKEQQEGE